MSTGRDQLYLDLFTTALEGGIGYWSVCSAYHWSNQGTDDFKGFYAVVKDDEAERMIDRAVIAKGYRLAVSADWRDRLRWSSEKPPLVVTEDTDWDYDAGDADIIVQLGLFGKVVYG